MRRMIMKELRSILRRLKELHRSGESCALATIVSVQGSSYRRPGARMLFSKNGREAGFISAACLEADLFEKVKEVMDGNKQVLFSYDTTAPEDAVFGIGHGCSGFLEILIEPIDAAQPPLSLALLQAASEQKEICAIATVFRSEGVNSEALGTKLFFPSSCRLTTSLAKVELTELLSQDITQALQNGRSTIKHYGYSETTADVFIEIIHPPVPLLVFGATPDVRPLVRLASEVGWNVTVIDHRSAFAVKKDFPDADTVLLLSPENYASHLQITPGTCAVIMIHQFAAEANALRFLLSSNVRYAGLLGPKTKCDLLLQHLAAEGFSPDEEQRTKLYNPVGLDFGAETAEEIAVSIVAEINAVINKRDGGFLKNRQGPIHENSHKIVEQE
jgi:xanthine dehydrogenase accessory factor